jgi:tyrosyl-tRNA synthetase
MFQERLKEEKPIYLHEFLYPLAQAYDSVAMDVDLEIGGNDQMFNMMCGRDLMKAMGKKDKAVLLTNILADGEGNKMGKTSGNALFLDTDANNMYGIIMSWPDEVIIPAFELVTKKPLTEIKALAKDLSSGKLNPRDAKMALALDITTLVHGEKSALEAADRFKQTVQKKEAPAKIETIKIGKEDNLLSATVQYFGTAKSKSDIRRLFDQNAIEVNGEKIKDFNQLAKTGDIIKAGKKDWFKIS